jgi:hypothetical protein
MFEADPGPWNSCLIVGGILIGVVFFLFSFPMIGLVVGVLIALTSIIPMLRDMWENPWGY